MLFQGGQILLDLLSQQIIFVTRSIILGLEKAEMDGFSVFSIWNQVNEFIKNYDYI